MSHEHDADSSTLMLTCRPTSLYTHAPVPETPGLPQALLVNRLQTAIDGTIGKLRDAMEAMVWRIAVHPSQTLGSMKYMELSIGYIAKAANVGRETARQAWHRLRGAAGWMAVSVHQVRKMGASLRKLSPGGLWGQHLLLHPRATAAALQVATSRKLGPIHTALPDAPGWEPLTPVRRGRHLMACCPWHDDQTPSVILNTNADGVSGSGVCLSCTDLEGGRLRLYWRSHHGVFVARHARSIATHQPALQSTGTIDNHTSLSGSRSHVLGRLHTGVMARRSSKCDDLLNLLVNADKRSRGDRVCDEAASDHARGESLPDQYVSTDQMVVTEWKVINTRRGEISVPDKWEPVSTRWVIADLDGFTDAPIDDAGLVQAAIEIERWAERQSGLSGRIGIVRTSHLGVQIVVELDSERTDPRRWYLTGEARVLFRGLDDIAMRAVRSVGFVGGHADQSVHAAGRMMRRPGWRVDKQGTLCRSRLAYASQTEGD